MHDAVSHFIFFFMIQRHENCKGNKESMTQWCHDVIASKGFDEKKGILKQQLPCKCTILYFACLWLTKHKTTHLGIAQKIIIFKNEIIHINNRYIHAVSTSTSIQLLQWTLMPSSRNNFPQFMQFIKAYLKCVR